MNVVAFDFETHLIRPAQMAPPPVCLSWQRPGEEPRILHAGSAELGVGSDRPVFDLIHSWLTSDVLLVGHNIAFDFGVAAARWPALVPLIFRAYDENRVADTMIRQQMLDIASGQFRGREQRFPKEITLSAEDVKDLIEAGMDIPEDGKKTVWGAKWIQHNYNLGDLIWRCAGRKLKKGKGRGEGASEGATEGDGTEDSWRLRYAELANVPVEQWPQDAIEYPLEDARATLDVFLTQEAHKEFIEDQFRQTRGAWALFLTQTWGLRTHGPGVDALERETIAALGEIEDGLKEAGLVRTGERVIVRGPDGQPKLWKNGKVRTRSGGKAGSRDTKMAKARMLMVCQATGKPVRLTDKGGICLDSDACAASEDDLLQDYAELSALKKMISNEIPTLRMGTVYPIHTRYGLAASGRSTSSGPNVQNPKRNNEVIRDGQVKYRLPDVREIWKPRRGYIYAQADFSSMELCTLAQCCVTLFGESELANTINAGRDPLTEFAVSLMGISYEEGMALKKSGDHAFVQRRQTAKVAMYGMPGGLGADTLVLYARKSYKVDITVEEAKKLKENWFGRFPEMRKFFAYCGSLVDADTGKGSMILPLSQRWRGGTHYTGICNSFFQGWASDCAKRATYLVQRACYAEPESVLYNSRPVLFVHDELVTEVLDDYYAHDKATEMARLMMQGANEFLPDVPVKAEPQLMTVWSKDAMDVFDERGRLVPWDPGMKVRKAVVYDKKGKPIVWKEAA